MRSAAVEEGYNQRRARGVAAEAVGGEASLSVPFYLAPLTAAEAPRSCLDEYGQITYTAAVT